MVEKHGLGTIVDAMNGLLDYTERRTRAALANIPHGVYESCWLHGQRWVQRHAGEGPGQDNRHLREGNL